MIGAVGKLIELQIDFGIISTYRNLSYDAFINSYTDTNTNNKTDTGEVVSLAYDFIGQGDFYNLDFTYTGSTIAGYPIYDYYGIFYIIQSSSNLIDLTGSSVVSAASITLCFLPETSIRLADNQQKQAGDLAVGDLVATPEGPKAVKFIGKTTRNIFDLRETGRMPIRIEAGSLGELGPNATIHCTPSHAFHIKGSLVEAQALVNGTTIQQLNDWDELMITYISIELEDHQLIWANGLLAETYYANFRSEGFSRQSWDNYDQYLELYGESESMKELDMPRIPFARQLPAELRLMLQLNESTKALQAV
jgi:hypothetical protein